MRNVSRARGPSYSHGLSCASISTSKIDTDPENCVGTPIQNRLEDLGSLIKFLRIAPFDNNAGFRHHISEPLLREPEAGDLNLRLLLGSVCLRRTRALLDLPDAKEETFTTSLSTEEKALYSEIIEDSRRAIDDSISVSYFPSPILMVCTTS